MVVNAFTCPFILLLNILVMVTVKTKRQVRTKSYVALACLATTDLMVGLVVQPLHITAESLLLEGEAKKFCALNDVSITVAGKCLMASLSQLILITVERYLAIKHPFAYGNMISEVHIIITSGLAWAAAVFLPTDDLLMAKNQLVSLLASCLILFLVLPIMIYFNIAVYKEVRRSDEQIAANQVSLEAKKKIVRNKKAFHTTVIVFLAIFRCFFPVRICSVILVSFKEIITVNRGHIAIYLFTLLPVLNSLFNPFIYAVRIRCIRLAFIQLLSRKTIEQAEELEKRIIGPRKIGVAASVE